MARDYLRMNRDDEQASRVYALAIRFFGASAPLDSETLNREFYPTLGRESFLRTYLRDRELLASCGLFVRDASEGQRASWVVDEEASYSSSDGLEGSDALALAVLCQDLVEDRSFAWHSELRMALAKIGYATKGAIVARGGAPQKDPRCLSALLSCHANRHLAEVAYRRADGAETERTLAIYGSFGLRGRVYFVAQREDAAQGDGAATEPRTYRLDRFLRVRELGGTHYDIPEDFDAEDYRRLPFQMGPQLLTGRFLVPEAAGRALRRAVAGQGTTRRTDQGLVWELPVSDTNLAASWAIGEGARPLGPDELVAAWQTALAGASVQSSLAPDEALPAERQPRRRRAGRSGGTNEARQLVALASNLTQSGRTLTAEAISSALGVDRARARHLITLLSMSSGESIDYLPVIVSDDDDEIELMEGANLAARRVRLTQSESHALLAALTELGVSETDSLYRALVGSFASTRIDRDEVLRTLEAPRLGTDAELLSLCSQAIGAHRGLRFCYTPVSGGEARLRHVAPQRTRRGDDAWYLEAYDLDRRGPRVFRVDHMSALELGEELPDDLGFSHPGPEKARIETVLFSDRRYLDLFDWDGIEVMGEDERGVCCEVPRYKGPWLATHLAACGGGARCGIDLTREVREVARSIEQAAR